MPNDVNCKYYDPINGWCEKLSDFGYPKRIEYCPKSPCEHAEPIEQPMNDNDIIKALEYCRIGKRENDCKKCPLYGRVPACVGYLVQDALNLINRQKAEIERLQHIRAELSKENEEQDQAIINALHRMKVVRAEAIKEFAEKISKIFERYSHMHNYAEKAKRCTIETDEGTSIELVSVWDVIELEKHEMVDYETMNELQDNIETISKERLLSELEKNFRLLVKEMTEVKNE